MLAAFLFAHRPLLPSIHSARSSSSSLGAGGGTDATARIIGSCWRGAQQPVSVVNPPAARAESATGDRVSAPDGYTLGLITVEITMMHHVGLTQLRHTTTRPSGW